MGVSGGGRLGWSTSSHCQLRQIPSEGGRRGRARGWAWHEVHAALPPRGQARQLHTPAALRAPRACAREQGGSPGFQCRLGSYTGLGPPPPSPGVAARPGARWSDGAALPSAGHPSQWRQAIALNSRRSSQKGGPALGAVPAAPPFTSGTCAGQQPPNLHGLLPHFRVVIQDSAPESDTPVPWIPHACGGADTDSAPITHSRAELDCAPWTSRWSTGCAAARRCWPTSGARPAPSRSCLSPSQ